MVARSKRGLIAPIHVRSHKYKQIQVCGNANCNTLMMSGNLKNPALDCIHLKSVGTALMTKHVELDLSYLTKLAEIGLIKESSIPMYKKLYDRSITEDCPLIVLADFSKFGVSTRVQYFSVFTGLKEYYSPFGRVRVSFDTGEGNWSCKCPLSGEKISCEHENVAKWFLCQTNISLLEENKR